MVTQAIDADRGRPMIESAIRAVHTVINAPGPGLLAGGGRRSTGSDSAAENETTRFRWGGRSPWPRRVVAHGRKESYREAGHRHPHHARHRCNERTQVRLTEAPLRLVTAGTRSVGMDT